MSACSACGVEFTDAGPPWLTVKGTDICSPCYDKFAEEGPELLAMLRELEWAGPDPDGGRGACPACGRSKPMFEFPSRHAPHEPDCRLAGLLGRFK